MGEREIDELTMENEDLEREVESLNDALIEARAANAKLAEECARLRAALEKFKWAASPEKHGGTSAYPYEEICDVLAATSPAAPESGPTREQVSSHTRCYVCLRGLERAPGDRRITCAECRSQYAGTHGGPTHAKLLELIEDAWWQWSLPTTDDTSINGPRCDGCLSTLEEIAEVLVAAGRIKRWPDERREWYVRAREAASETRET